MDEGTLRGVIAVVTLATFLGICWWACRGANARRFEEAGRLPFEDGATGAESNELRRGERP
jgi:cytochrome c oxidase cbb3-type subunit IV